MKSNFIAINALDNLRYIHNLVLENRCDCFPVMENGQIVGVLTYKDILTSHPNRIVADAMSDNPVYIDATSSIWQAKEIFDTSDAELLLVKDNKKFLGLITRTLLDTEIGKHMDLLTELYKSDYIYYHAMKLIESNQEMSMLFLDVNNFGQIDKDHGHINGDIILKQLGALLASNMTEQTHVARFGGDEFLVLTPYCLKQCKIFTQNLLKTIASYSFHNNISVTASAGIAEHKKCQEDSRNMYTTISNLINLASLASTKAKQDNCELSIADHYAASIVAG